MDSGTGVAHVGRHASKLSAETESPDSDVQTKRVYARFAGFLYLAVLAFDIAGAVIVSSISGSGNFIDTAHRIAASEVLYRIGLCCGLVGSLSTILLAVSLYVVVRPIDGNLAMTALLFRVVESAIGAVGTVLGFATLQIYLAANHANAFGANQLGALADLNAGVATDVSAIFFCVGSTIFFYLFVRSTYIPRILAVWGVLASLFYMAAFVGTLIVPQYSGILLGIGSLPILVAEVSTALWLLIRGIETQPLASQPVGTTG